MYNTLGYGFLEKIYENCLRVSLRKQGVGAAQQLPIAVLFEGEHVGEHFADLLVNRKVVVEVNAAQAIATEHECQLVNYLKATGYRVGLILNFDPQAEFGRRVFTP